VGPNIHHREFVLHVDRLHAAEFGQRRRLARPKEEWSDQAVFDEVSDVWAMCGRCVGERTNGNDHYKTNPTQFVA